MTASASKLAAIVLILMTTAACGREPPSAGKGNNAAEEVNVGVMNDDLANNAIADPGNDVVEPEGGNNVTGPVDNADATAGNDTAPPQ